MELKKHDNYRLDRPVDAAFPFLVLVAFLRAG